MPKLYSNPWKNKVGIKSRAKYAIRTEFYKWLLRRYCKGCKTVVDIACGPGQFMKVANRMGFNAVGIDADERYKAKNVIIGDLWDFKGKYDVVFNNMIMEHLDDQEKFVKKMTQLSNNIVITISAYASKSFWNVPDHKKPVTKVSVRWLFRRYGFRTLLSMHVPLYQAVIVVSKKVTDKDKDWESKKIREGFW
jgi:2-polyprenyl-3-methyl-5-hydroxy-6-metoxy-1,4-benzoquinol methylase